MLILIVIILLCFFVIKLIQAFREYTCERMRPSISINSDYGSTEIKNNNYPLSFVAVDTETADKAGHICQIAYVSVEDGQIVRKNSFLVRPVKNHYDFYNTKIHNITATMTENAPDITEVWPEILNEIYKCSFLVAHNAEFDIRCLRLSLEAGGGNDKILDTVNIIDTCELSGHSSLYSCCQYFNIPIDFHHDALCDAEACAKVLLCLRDDPHPFIPHVLEPKQKKEKRKVEITHINTPFSGKKVVVSGEFERYPYRDELKFFLESCGASVPSSLSSRTDMFVYGANPGPAKMQKAMDLSSSGTALKFISEKKLYEMIDEIN